MLTRAHHPESQVPINSKLLKKAVISKFKHLQPLKRVSELGTSMRVIMGPLGTGNRELICNPSFSGLFMWVESLAA